MIAMDPVPASLFSSIGNSCYSALVYDYLQSDKEVPRRLKDHLEIHYGKPFTYLTAW